MKQTYFRKAFLLAFCFVALCTHHIFAQTTIFSENIGAGSGTTLIPAYTGWQNNGVLTFTGSSDVRNTTPSTGYAGASGNGNVFITSTVGKDFQIASVNTTNYASLVLSFGVYKSTTASNGSELIVEVSSDGVTYTTLTVPALSTGTGTATWSYRTASGTIPSTANLRIRFRQNGSVPQFRIDDVSLTGCLKSTWYADADADTYGNSASSTTACTQPGGYVANSTDCNDANSAIHPGAAEVCNGVDDDCAGGADNGLTFLNYYTDGDGDGYGDSGASPVSSCSAVSGRVTNNTDCNDGNNAIHPGVTEVCNGVDDDCTGGADNGLTFLNYYTDGDADGYGDAGASPESSCSAVSGKVTDNTDCDDTNGAVHPGAAETCNGVDDDCVGGIDNGLTTLNYYTDGDTDGYGDSGASPVSSCSAVAGKVTDNTDCDDTNGAVHPGAAETCNGVDDDCTGGIDNGLTTLNYYTDGDTDGYGDSGASPVSSCSAVSGSVTDNTDCNDADGAIHPGAADLCNGGIDDDCDGTSDEDATFTTYYYDADHDTYGDPLNAGSTCSGAPANYVSDNTDCNDANAAVNPGATEICNSIDDNCNGDIDNDDAGITGQSTWYIDDDLDTYGFDGPGIQSCTQPGGYVGNNTDCDDTNGAVHPGAAETCNGVDDDCFGGIDNGITFTTYYADADGDLYGDPTVSETTCYPASGGYVTDNTDCDDTNAAINPGAVEICNSVDDNCNGDTDEGAEGLFYADVDEDGYGDATSSVSACSAPSGYVFDNTDCNDADAAVNPGRTESCNGVDDNCTGGADEGLTFANYYADADGDLYGDAGSSVNTCSGVPGGYVEDSGDCDDTDPSINPGAAEQCNEIDDDCNGTADDGLTYFTVYYDLDHDGYGNASEAHTTCVSLAGYAGQAGDCDILDPAINPGASEVCNMVDDNCDGLTDGDDPALTGGGTFYADTDGDLYGDNAVSVYTCDAPSGYVADGGDCDDTNSAINPGATELCNDMDEDCDGDVDEDLTLITYYADSDEDGYGDAAITTESCSATAPSGYSENDNDCDDADAAIHPGAADLCNGVDEDCDGSIDEDALFTTYYIDFDNDLYGDALNSDTTFCNTPGAGYVLNNTDCDDNNSTVNPGETEVCNGVDDDCDGDTDEGVVSAVISPSGTVSVCKGESVALHANTGTGYTYQWKRNGNIIPGATGADYNAVKQGNYVVQVNLPEGCFAASAPVSVTFYAAPNANVTAPNGNDLCGHAFVKLKASAQAGYSWQWYKDGSPISGAVNYLYNATTVGNYACRITNANGCSRNTAPFSVISSCREGLTESRTTNVLLYPNPTIGNFVLEATLETSISAEAAVTVYDMMGNTVLYKTVYSTDGDIREEFSLDNTLAAGIYYVQISTADSQSVQQIILAR